MRWLIVCLLLVALFASLDSAAGTYREAWPPAFVGVANFFTQFGLSGWYLIPAALWLLVANLTDWHALSRRRLMAMYDCTCLAFFTLAAVGMSGITVNVIKYGFGRARPLNFDELGAFGFRPFAFDARFASFPSGHATTVGALCGMLILLFPRSKYVVVPIALWIASTRVFVGAHYPSDTVAGLGLGLAFAIATALVFARLGFMFRHTPAGWPEPRLTFGLARPWLS